MLSEILQSVFRASLIVFLVGNLSCMGLQLDLADAVRPLRQFQFVLVTMVASFVCGPILAMAVTWLVPLPQPYAVGLLLLGLAPAAPFLPLVVKNGKGDLSAAAALMLLASVGTVLIMPLAVPRIAPGMPVSTWTVAKPLLFLVLAPLFAGLAVRQWSAPWAELLYKWDRVITGIGTAVFLAVVVVTNFKSTVGAIGSYAFAAQIVFVSALTLTGYLLALGLQFGQRVVVSLGMCTRNIGAAVAIARGSGDEQIIVMLVIGTVVTVGMSFMAAAWFGRHRSAEMLPSPAMILSQSRRH